MACRLPSGITGFESVEAVVELVEVLVEFGDPNSAGVVGATFLFEFESVDFSFEMCDCLFEYPDHESLVLLADLDQAETSLGSAAT